MTTKECHYTISIAKQMSLRHCIYPSTIKIISFTIFLESVKGKDISFSRSLYCTKRVATLVAAPSHLCTSITIFIWVSFTAWITVFTWITVSIWFGTRHMYMCLKTSVEYVMGWNPTVITIRVFGNIANHLEWASSWDWPCTINHSDLIFQ